MNADTGRPTKVDSDALVLRRRSSMQAPNDDPLRRRTSPTVPGAHSSARAVAP